LPFSLDCLHSCGRRVCPIMECERQSRLFCCGAKPLIFFVPPCAEADRLRLLITSGGGAVVARPGGVGVIHLVTGSKASGACAPLGGQLVHARFVEECFSQQRLLPLRECWAESSALPREEVAHSPGKSDFELRAASTHSSPPRTNGLLGSATKHSSPARIKRWPQELSPAKGGVGGRCDKCFSESEPVEHTGGQLAKLAGVAQVRSEASPEIAVSDQLSDELAGVAQVRSAPAGAVHAEASSVAELSFAPGRRRIYFTDADDEAMIRWASCHPQLGDQGRVLWEMAERAGVTRHGWASMQTRWRRQLKRRLRNSEAVSFRIPKREKPARVVRRPAATAGRLEEHVVEQPTGQALVSSPTLPRCISPGGQQDVVEGRDDAVVGSGAGVTMEGVHGRLGFAASERTSRAASDHSANRCTSPPRLRSSPATPIRALMQRAPLWLQATQRLEVHIDDHDI